MSLSELGRYNEALPGLEKGFRRSTDPALKRLAGLQLERAYTGLKRDSKAVEVALELNRLYPEDPEVLYHTGRLFGNFAYLSMRKLSQVSVITENSGRPPEPRFDQLMLAEAGVLTDSPSYHGD